MRWRLTGCTILIAIIILLQACHANHQLGASTPERLIERYLVALETKDENLLRQLVPANYAATPEIKAKIGKLGGHKIQEHQFIYTKSKPTLWSVTINGFYLDRNKTRQKFEDIISIAYEGKESWKLYQGRWYLLLGKSNLISHSIALPELLYPYQDDSNHQDRFTLLS
jgi:hypothetical protein